MDEPGEIVSRHGGEAIAGVRHVVQPERALELGAGAGVRNVRAQRPVFRTRVESPLLRLLARVRGGEATGQDAGDKQRAAFLFFARELELSAAMSTRDDRHGAIGGGEERLHELEQLRRFDAELSGARAGMVEHGLDSDAPGQEHVLDRHALARPGFPYRAHLGQDALVDVLMTTSRGSERRVDLRADVGGQVAVGHLPIERQLLPQLIDDAWGEHVAIRQQRIQE